MNSIIQAMEERRSYRKFKEEMPKTNYRSRFICGKWHGKTGDSHHCYNEQRST